ncbi:MAG: DUF2807 domain-containing protein [Bacteroidaceae bacterium]|jgi:hypothetical protein|nr:DUF2807 domain-containing protein [Bacteroidaceae bacterium]
MMEVKTFCKLTLGCLLVLNVSACKSDSTSNVKDGTVVISGNLTYDKLKDALSPFVNKNESTKGWETSNDFVTKTIQIDENLRTIDASCVIDILFVQSENLSVRMVIPKKWANYYTMKYRNGCLEAGQDGMKNVRINGNQDRVKLYVSAPNLSALNLSGASSAKIDNLKLISDFLANCSGASNIAIKKLIGEGNLKIDYSGASNFAVEDARVRTVEADVSGASNVSLGTLEATKVSGDISGCSHIYITGEFDKISMDVSGVSKATLRGKADRAQLSASGMSKINIKDLICSNVDKDTSGMSHIEK